MLAALLHLLLHAHARTCRSSLLLISPLHALSFLSHALSIVVYPQFNYRASLKHQKMSSLDEESMEDRSAAPETASAAVVVEGSTVVASLSAHDKDDDDDDDDTAEGQADVESMTPDDDDDDATTIKSEADEASIASAKPKKATPKGKKKKSRSPAVKGLTIPFRNVKRTMKLDPDIATVQQEAAILTTLASELFLKSLAQESFQNAQSRGRTTIR